MIFTLHSTRWRLRFYFPQIIIPINAHCDQSQIDGCLLKITVQHRTHCISSSWKRWKKKVPTQLYYEKKHKYWYPCENYGRIRTINSLWLCLSWRDKLNECRMLLICAILNIAIAWDVACDAWARFHSQSGYGNALAAFGWIFSNLST